jgi:hypothetical protein
MGSSILDIDSCTLLDRQRLGRFVQLSLYMFTTNRVYICALMLYVDTEESYYIFMAW